MKEFLEKYIWEIVTTLTISLVTWIFISVRKFINWVVKIKFEKPVEELRQSILQFKILSDSLNDSLKNVKDFTESFKNESVSNIERIAFSVGTIAQQLEDVSNKLDDKIERLRLEVKEDIKLLNKKIDEQRDLTIEQCLVHNSIHKDNQLKLRK